MFAKFRKIKTKYIVFIIIFVFVFCVVLDGYFRKKNFLELCDPSFAGKEIEDYDKYVTSNFDFNFFNIKEKEINGTEVYKKTSVLYMMFKNDMMYCEISYEKSGKILNVELHSFRD